MNLTPLARRIALALAASPALVTLSLGQTPPRVSAGGETLEGTWTGKPAVAVFRGIPYAAPPVGSLRWKAPEPPRPRPGLRAAVAAGPSCPQSNRLDAFVRGIAAAFGRADQVPASNRRTSEDCLTLNVWTTDPRPASPGRPVMVWIHGGSNLSGEGSDPTYDGSALARRGVVVVTINYRLGALGFLAHPALTAESPHRTSGNYGLLDQIAALRWVQAEIGKFGGDPTRVTVFGESAGSLNLLLLMAAPAARGLFQRAIAQSGAPMGMMPRLAAAEPSGLALAEALGIAANDLTSLRTVPADSVRAAADRLQAAGRLTLGPVVDGALLPDAPGRLFDRGAQAAVPLLIGSNAREMSSLPYYLPRFERTVAGYQAYLQGTAGPLAAKLGALYPAATDGEVESTLISLVTDLFFTCPSRFAARRMAKAGAPAWLYHFTRVRPGGKTLGAYHGAEIAYAFGTLEAWLPNTEEDRALSDVMMRYWVRFAETGDPNQPGLPNWSAHTAESDRYLELDTPPAARVGLRREACDLADLSLPLTWGPIPGPTR